MNTVPRWGGKEKDPDEIDPRGEACYSWEATARLYHLVDEEIDDEELPDIV